MRKDGANSERASRIFWDEACACLDAHQRWGRCTQRALEPSERSTAKVPFIDNRWLGEEVTRDLSLTRRDRSRDPERREPGSRLPADPTSRGQIARRGAPWR